MSRDVISVDGEKVVVREDTAKAYRGVNWAITSIAIMIVIMIGLFLTFFWKAASDGSVEGPGPVTNSTSRP